MLLALECALPLLCRNFYSDLFQLLRAVTRLKDISNELRDYSKEMNEVRGGSKLGGVWRGTRKGLCE